MPYRQTIAAAYDAGVEEEYNRLVETPLREAEYKLIVELLDEYIPENQQLLILVRAGSLCRAFALTQL
ncbi:MAG: hypothetical protein HC905_01045 [Bacteroidales bacterium]|nr:hypothetical protein [Bacteroidales bacterium]